MTGNDPRVFFAAERTLLAWVRTALGLVGLGFVVARFGLFLRLVRPDLEHGSHSWAAGVGVALALLGAVLSATAAWQHRRFCSTLADNERPPKYRAEPVLLLGFGAAVAGAALAVILTL
jgi:putative membrane protein